jgi:TIR domain
MFVSYAWKDREHVEALCARLRADGTEYWLDSERLDLGSALGPQLVDAVAHASGVILIDSRASRASNWVEFELRSARSRGKTIVLHPLCAR